MVFELQETVREYELRMDRLRDYEAMVEDLQGRLVRLREEKYRDDMLIE